VQNEEEDDQGLGVAAALITNLVRLFFCVFLSSGGLSLSFQFAQQLLIGRELPVKKLRLFLFFFQWKEKKGWQSLFMFLVDCCLLVSWVLALFVNSRVSKISYSYTALRALSGFVFEVLGEFCRFFFFPAPGLGQSLELNKGFSTNF
jgi:hypothetical protein